MEMLAALVTIDTDTAAWLTAAATLVLAGAAIVALLSLSGARRTRHAELVTDLSRRWDEPLAASSRELHLSYGADALLALVGRIYSKDVPASSEDVDAYFALQAWLNLIETLGALKTEHAISSRIIFKLWGAPIVSAWEKWEPAVNQVRIHEEHPGVYRNFQKLAKKMRWRLRREARLIRAQQLGARGVRSTGHGIAWSGRLILKSLRHVRVNHR